jgi:hypothetical protein
MGKDCELFIGYESKKWSRLVLVTPAFEIHEYFTSGG